MILLRGIEIDLTSVWGSELTWSSRGRKKMLGFSVWIEIKMVSCGGIEIDLTLGWGSSRLDLCSSVEINIIFV